MSRPHEDADDEPFVVLDSAAEVESLTSASLPGDLLSELCRRGAECFAADAAVQRYLAKQGITDARVCSAYRLGVGDAAMEAGLDATQREVLADLCLFSPTTGLALSARGGFNLPTFDPREPHRVVGLVRMTFGQNKHRFLSPPVGLGCTATIADVPRVILADAPLLGLRLAQLGVPGVAIVEHPDVLPPLHPWLAQRQVVLAGFRGDRLAALRAALGPLGPSAIIAPVMPVIANSPEASLTLLGLDRSAVRIDEPRPPITPLLIHEIIDYARARLASGEAAQALAVLEADVPDLVAAYRLGYLPGDVRGSLSRSSKRALAGHRLGGTVIVPALDEQGVAVDLLVLHPRVRGRTNDGLTPEPLGLLAPEVLHVSDTLIVTDTFRWLARLFRQGYRNVLLLRGVADAERNAARIAAAGVRRIELRARASMDELAAVLQRAGMSVEIVRGGVGMEDHGEGADAAASAPALAPAPVALAPAVVEPVAESPSPAPSPLAVPTAPPSVAAEAPTATEPAPTAEAVVFVEEDRSAEVAIFQAGAVRFAVELRDDGDTRREVVLRAHGQAVRDRFDLAVDAQRQRFADNAARRVRLPSPQIAAHLVALLDAVRAREDSATLGPAVTVDPADRAEALNLLQAPDLLARITADLTALGWVDEERAQVLLYLTAISRLLPSPLWSVYRASAGATPWQGLGLIAALTPSEDLVVFHRVTDALLSQTDARALRHRLLLIDQAETLRPEAALALRVLHERGGIGWSTVASGASAASGRPLLGEARGPVAVLAAAAGEVDHRCRDCFLTVMADESAEQIARILAQQRHRHAGVAALSHAERHRLLARHHALQRVLERRAVVIPFVERIAFPAASIRHRAEQARFLALIEASALLHQRQRQREGSAILADEQDFAIAVRLSDGLLGSGGDGLSRPGRQLLERVFAAGLASFTMADLGGLMPDWSRWAFRAALQELLDFGHVVSPRSRRGQLRRFQLAARAASATRTRGIVLRPLGAVVERDEVGGLAEVGGAGRANFTPDQAVG